MNKGMIAIIVVVAIILMGGIWYAGTYNSIVSLQEETSAKWAQVENQLKRRCDLIPDLISVANKYLASEQSIIEEISNARAALLGAKTPAEQIEMNEQLTTSLSSLIAIGENYPDLKSNQQYLNVMDEMAGTENRIAVARKDYNEVIEEYNKTLIMFPSSIVANAMGAEKVEYFEVAEEELAKPDYDLDIEEDHSETVVNTETEVQTLVAE